MMDAEFDSRIIYTLCIMKYELTMNMYLHLEQYSKEERCICKRINAVGKTQVGSHFCLFREL